MRSEPRPWQRVAELGGLAVLLIRHGRTDFNATHRFCGGRSDPPLDERGREQVEALGARLRGEQIDALFCSPQLRARETAAVLGEPVVIEALRELDQGALEGRDIQPALTEHAEFFAAWKIDPTDVPVPGGGESMGTLADRVTPAIDGIIAGLEAPRGVIGIVGHQMAQAAFVCRALGRPLRDWPQYQLRNATANLLVWDRGRWDLAGRNL